MTPGGTRVRGSQQIYGRMLANSGTFALVLLLAGCATVYEAQILQIDAPASMQSPTVQADRVVLDLLTWPETTISEGPRHFFLAGPYAVSVEVYAAASSPRGKLAAIEVSEAVLEIRYGDADVREVALSTVADDWNAEPGPQWGKFALHQSKTPRLDVDFRRLKEIRFRLKFTGVYVNGGRREYWLERYLTPKVFIEMEPSGSWWQT